MCVKSYFFAKLANSCDAYCGAIVTDDCLRNSMSCKGRLDCLDDAVGGDVSEPLYFRISGKVVHH